MGLFDDDRCQLSSCHSTSYQESWSHVIRLKFLESYFQRFVCQSQVVMLKILIRRYLTYQDIMLGWNPSFYGLPCKYYSIFYAASYMSTVDLHIFPQAFIPCYCIRMFFFYTPKCSACLQLLHSYMDVMHTIILQIHSQVISGLAEVGQVSVRRRHLRDVLMSPASVSHAYHNQPGKPFTLNAVLSVTGVAASRISKLNNAASTSA